MLSIWNSGVKRGWVGAQRMETPKEGQVLLELFHMGTASGKQKAGLGPANPETGSLAQKGRNELVQRQGGSQVPSPARRPRVCHRGSLGTCWLTPAGG